MSFKENVQELQNMIFTGKLLEAFEKFYGEDVVMQENFEEPRTGKAANRAYEEKFVASVEAIHDGGISNITYDEAKQVAMVESWMDVSFKGGPRVKMGQVAVQQWQGDQIVHERFYHS